MKLYEDILTEGELLRELKTSNQADIIFYMKNGTRIEVKTTLTFEYAFAYLRHKRCRKQIVLPLCNGANGAIVIQRRDVVAFEVYEAQI